jgi:meso-butanediol dehydrogenase/(S,S)-butanediol dehydrogenase/diacetyl reductase
VRPQPRSYTSCSPYTGDRRGLPAAEGETFEKFSETIALAGPADTAGRRSFVAYLAGTGADYMTGQAGLVDGGMIYR